MNVTSKATESIRHQDDWNASQTGSSPQVIQFFTARDRLIGERNDQTSPFGCGHQRGRIPDRRELLHPLCDPVEDWLNSLISGAALVSLLIGILCLPSFTTSNTERLKLLPISQTEAFLKAQKPD
jgi:hypothetical protein